MTKDRMTSAEFRESGLQIRGTSNRPVTDYKAEFEKQLRDEGLPTPETEFQFNEKRKWRFDYVYRKEMIAIEYEGGHLLRRQGRPHLGLRHHAGH